MHPRKTRRQARTNVFDLIPERCFMYSLSFLNVERQSGVPQTLQVFWMFVPFFHLVNTSFWRNSLWSVIHTIQNQYRWSTHIYLSTSSVRDPILMFSIAWNLLSSWYPFRFCYCVWATTGVNDYATDFYSTCFCFYILVFGREGERGFCTKRTLMMWHKELASQLMSRSIKRFNRI